MAKLFVFLTMAALCACQPSPAVKPVTEGSAAPKVVATVGMAADVARQVGGPEVEIVAMMGPGVDPHLYRPTAGDLRELETADVVLAVGLELEGRMEEALVRLRERGKQVVLLGEGLPTGDLREVSGFKGRFDPHVWFDVSIWAKTAPLVAEALTKVDPDGGEEYKSAAKSYQERMAVLDDWVKRKTGEVPPAQRVLVTAHDAFGYFGRRYGFEVLGIQGTSTATEASTAEISRLAGIIASRKVKAVFVETSVPRNTVEALQRAVQAKGWTVKIGPSLFSDAMGDPGTPEGTYEGMVRHNVLSIVESLK
jgi:manganese/zinc/iron transport system substrate-binding protein